MLGKESEYILGLFFSDENTIVYDSVKLSQSLSEESLHHLKLISFKFLGPLFMTSSQKGWKIDYIETTLTPLKGIINNTPLQSFTCLNSSKEIAGSLTNLFTFIGSPYTEDIAGIYERLTKFIHPSITQGKLIAQTIHGDRFDYNKFIEDEINRGSDLIEHTLGTSRKIYWEEKLAYSTIAVIKRTYKDGSLKSDLYTFDLDDPFRKEALEHIPSYYFMGILPDYYEKRMIETLKLFGVDLLYPNIIKIKVSNSSSEVLYIEEFLIDSDEKLSYGLILIPSNNKIKESNDVFQYKKKLRLMLDKKKEFERSVIELNSRINPFKNWSLDSEENLRKIDIALDSRL